MSCVLFATKAFNIEPIAPNAVLFIKSIFLTQSGNNSSSTGIVLEWSGGTVWIKWNVTLDNLRSSSLLATDGSGKIVPGIALDIYNLISWYMVWWGDSLWKTGANNILTPIQIAEVKFQIGSWSIASWMHAIVMGENNLVDENSANGSIVWWQNNRVTNGNYSIVWWGQSNTIGWPYNIIGWWSSNTIQSTDRGFIWWGDGNQISEKSTYSIIAWGIKNTVLDTISAFIWWGELNQIIKLSLHSIIAWGYKNIIEGATKSFIWWWEENIIRYSSNYSSIVGGNLNMIQTNSSYDFIWWGYYNYINANERYSSILWGNRNQIINQKEWSNNVILGGELNSISPKNSANYSVIAGWYRNFINGENGNYSFVAWYQAQARHNNVFVRNSDLAVTFASDRSNTFLINAPFDEKAWIWGVGINTNNPQAALDVNGNIRTNGQLNVYWINNNGGITTNTITAYNSITTNGAITTNGNVTAAYYSALSWWIAYLGINKAIDVSLSWWSTCTLIFTQWLLTNSDCPD